MTASRLTDDDLRLAFEQRAAGFPDPGLPLRIGHAIRQAPARRPHLVVLPGGRGRRPLRARLADRAMVAAVIAALVAGLGVLQPMHPGAGPADARGWLLGPLVRQPGGELDGEDDRDTRDGEDAGDDEDVDVRADDDEDDEDDDRDEGLGEAGLGAGLPHLPW
jgi:hypothetical protein